MGQSGDYISFLISRDLTEPGAHHNPERMLLAAILARAALDYTGFEHHHADWHRLANLAETWIYCDSDDEWGFLWICAELEINPHKVRTQIEHLRQERMMSVVDGKFTPRQKRFPRVTSGSSGSEQVIRDTKLSR